jgi:hypothetical protein
VRHRGAHIDIGRGDCGDRIDRCVRDEKFTSAAFGPRWPIAAIGFVDDGRTIPVVPRLLLPGAAVAFTIVAVPKASRSSYLPAVN